MIVHKSFHEQCYYRVTQFYISELVLSSNSGIKMYLPENKENSLHSGAYIWSLNFANIHIYKYLPRAPEKVVRKKVGTSVPTGGKVKKIVSSSLDGYHKLTFKTTTVFKKFINKPWEAQGQK